MAEAVEAAVLKVLKEKGWNAIQTCLESGVATETVRQAATTLVLGHSDRLRPVLFKLRLLSLTTQVELQSFLDSSACDHLELDQKKFLEASMGELLVPSVQQLVSFINLTMGSSFKSEALATFVETRFQQVEKNIEEAMALMKKQWQPKVGEAQNKKRKLEVSLRFWQTTDEEKSSFFQQIKWSDSSESSEPTTTFIPVDEGWLGVTLEKKNNSAAAVDDDTK
ncbi:hypothetical protein L7F22_038449 [Adiantum nelumboides]|nr:hypothetical protein [Adiantum nelumboides]